MKSREAKQEQSEPQAAHTVLVVEDSPVNLHLALMQLETLGYPAASAVNGREALDCIAKDHYDIILMDCQMPEMDGFEATWQIRNRESQHSPESPKVTPVCIIAMTADTAQDSREKCLAAGMNDYIRKPVKVTELEAALDRAIRGPEAGGLEEVLDPLVLAGLRMLRQPGRPDPVVELITLFLEEAPERLSFIREAVAANDMWSMSKIVAAATSLKGSSSNIGARDLAAVSGRIEQAARNGVLDEAGALLQEATDELERVRLALAKVE
jgi:CheY-like chemotaxis protein/HPt (histidine-containing phosphotransfer) domain-containing protein